MSHYSETRRQAVHVAMVGFAFLLRWLTWWQGALLAVSALAFNAFVLPRAGGRHIYRPADVARGASIGILFYPSAVLLLVLALPNRLDLVAAAWAILAIGDGFATIAGRAVDGRRLPWNADKTWAGLVAFVIMGGTAAVGLAWWTAPSVVPVPAPAFLVAAPLAAAIIAGLVETVPVRLDDNLSVPFAAGLTLWIASLMSAEAWAAHAADVQARIAAAVAINVVMAVLARALGGVTRVGAVVGLLLGVTIYLGAGLAGWTMLLVSFAFATGTAKLGWKRKSVLGIAEDRGGRRGPGNAIANVLVGAVAAALAVLSPYSDAALLILVTALTAGASDTVASEVGKAWGRRTFLVVGFVSVKPGTPGAISLEGTTAGLAAALAMGALGTTLGLIPYHAVGVVVVASTIGAFAESALGATLEPAGMLNNDWLNFLTTAIAAAVALLAWRGGA